MIPTTDVHSPAVKIWSLYRVDEDVVLASISCAGGVMALDRLLPRPG